ncbi:AAA family ATPase [Pseudonocardia sediminis]|uniref:AAA family ATPase n=1 Tax=Pseudonocardia sediminis TaxID=1397368 RepID=UPI0010296DDF|nr:AAA family ATPase [Pseudonocardia sediminis]
MKRPLIYSVTREWLDAVARGGSLFLPEASVWTPETIEALYQRIVGDPQTDSSGFQEKLLHQVHQEGEAAQRLAAEAMFVFQIKDASGRAATKRAQIQALLAGLEPSVRIPERLEDALSFGMARYGSGRMRSLYDYLFVLRLAKRWAQTTAEDRQTLLVDPDAFRTLLDDVHEKGAVFAREATKHLVHPEAFEPIAALTAKQKILREVGQVKVRTDTDLDQELRDLRRRMTAEGFPEGFSFYDTDIRPLWNPPDIETPDGEGPDGEEPTPTTPQPRVASRLRLSDVVEAAEDARLVIPERVLAAVVAALNSGKHVILTGAPGTAKTTLAELVARTAERAGRCRGHVLATATADWSTYETVGGYRPRPQDGGLEFAPGLVLDAILHERWLVLDEMNRANTDRALGPLFTVLSGQAVAIAAEQNGRPVRIRPEATAPDESFHDYVVPAGWRIIATTNILDRALLFDLSFALMRRFAFIEVNCPDHDGYLGLIHDAVADLEEEVRGRAEAVVGALLPLREVRELGPALFRDAARFVAGMLADLPTASRVELALAAFHAYLLPQFEGIDEREAGELRSRLTLASGSSASVVTALLRRSLGVFAAERTSGFSDDVGEADAEHSS